MEKIKQLQKDLSEAQNKKTATDEQSFANGGGKSFLEGKPEGFGHLDHSSIHKDDSQDPDNVSMLKHKNKELEKELEELQTTHNLVLKQNKTLTQEVRESQRSQHNNNQES